MSFASILTSNTFWVAFGLVGQAAFFERFLVQWLASEKAGKSTIPISFWYFSIIGATILLAYAIHQKDPVFILGQSAGFLIYFRNLWLIRKTGQSASD